MSDFSVDTGRRYLAALKFCFKTCVAMKFVDDDDDDDDDGRRTSSMAWCTTSTTGCSFNGPRCSQSLQKVFHTTLAPLLFGNSSINRVTFYSFDSQTFFINTLFSFVNVLSF